MKVALLTPCIANRDAVSNDIVGMYNVLKKHHYDVRLFCDSNHTTFPIGNIHHINNWLSENDVIIYHHSIGWELGTDVFLNTNCKKIVKHHNVTPPEYFRESHQLYNACVKGLQELNLILNSDVINHLVDSEYTSISFLNKQNKSYNTITLPPFNHIAELGQVNPLYSATTQQYNDWNINILMVGRIVPNKNYELAIETFDIYNQKYNNNSRLIMVGITPVAEYHSKLSEIISNRRLQNKVFFTGSVSNEELKGLYLMSDVLLVTSKHEGFCVPLIESMYMKLPIVTVNASAIPFTCGHAAAYAHDNANDLSSRINDLISDNNLREKIVNDGWERYKNNFTHDEIETKFIDYLKAI